MDCRSARERLHDYLGHELDASDTHVIDGHLRVCPSCKSVFERGEKFRMTVRRAGKQVAVPPGLRAAVQSRLREAHSRPAPSAWLTGRRLAPALAALVLMTAVLYIVRLATLPTTQAPQRAGIANVSGLLAAIVEDHRLHGDRLPPPDPEAQQDLAMRQYRDMLGTLPTLPPRFDSGYRREHCLLCPVGNGRMPHVQYRRGARVVSVFLTPASGVTINGRDASTLAYHQLYAAQYKSENVLLWKDRATVYVLVSRESPDTLVDVSTEIFRSG